VGYGQSAFGVPNPDWFNQSMQPPRVNALQTDFVWGFLFANPLKTPANVVQGDEP
jgi:hypothetical protein